MGSSLPITVLWNPSTASAFNAEIALDELRRWPNTRIERLKEASDIRQIFEGLSDHAGLIVAAGGDGTIRNTVNALMEAEYEATLGILPLGTGNDLARTLGIPLEPLAALSVLRDGIVTSIDLFEFTSNGRKKWCSNMITGGNTGRYLEDMSDEIKQTWGPLCYLRGVVDVLQTLEVFDIQLTCSDGRPESFQALNLFLANGRTSGGGLSVAPSARLDDGLIDVIVIRDGEAGQIAGLTAEYLLSDYLEHELVEFRQCRSVQITSNPPLPLTADGDVIGTTPLDVRVRDGAMRILVPRASQTALGESVESDR